MKIYFAGDLKAAIDPKYNKYYKHILQSHFEPNEDILKFAFRQKRREQRKLKLKRRT